MPLAAIRSSCQTTTCFRPLASSIILPSLRHFLRKTQVLDGGRFGLGQFFAGFYMNSKSFVLSLGGERQERDGEHGLAL